MSDERGLLAALAAALAHNPGAKTSELAVAVGLSRATLSRRFASRAELVRCVIIFALDVCEEILRRRGSLRALVDALCARGRELAVLLHLDGIVESDPSLKARTEELLALIHARIQEGRRGRLLRRDLPERWQVRILADLVWSGWAAVQAGEIGSKECSELVWRSWLEGQQRAREA